MVGSNNQSQGVSGATPAVAQARQTDGGLGAELARRMESYPAQTLIDINETMKEVLFKDKSKMTQEQVDKQEQDALNKSAESLKQIKQIPPELVAAVGDKNLSNSERIDKLLDVVKILEKLNIDEKNSTIKSEMKVSLFALETTLSTMSLTDKKTNPLAKIFSNSNSIEDDNQLIIESKVNQLNDLRSPISVARYVSENPFVLSNETNRKILINYLLKEDSPKPINTEEFNSLIMDSLAGFSAIMPASKIVEKMTSALTNMLQNESEQPIVKGMVLMEGMVQAGIIKEEDILKQVPILAQAISENPTPRNKEQMMNLIVEAVSDLGILKGLTSKIDPLAHTTAIRLIAEKLSTDDLIDMPELKEELEGLLVPKTASNQQSFVSSEIVEQVIGLDKAQKERQISNIFKQSDTIISSDSKLEQLKKANDPMIVARYVQDNPVVLTDKLASETNRRAIISYMLQEGRVKPKDAGEFNSLAMETINNISGMTSPEQMSEILSSALTGIAADKSVANVKLLEKMIDNQIIQKNDIQKYAPSLVQRIQKSNIAFDKDIAPSITSNKNVIDEKLADIMKSSNSANQKLIELNKLNEPMAVVRYVKEKYVETKKPIMDAETRKALLGYLMQEDRVNTKNIVEFKILTNKIVQENIDKKDLIEELVKGVALVKDAKADFALVNALVLLEDIIDNQVMEASLKLKMSEVFDLIKYDQIPRSEKEINNIIITALSNPSISLDIANQEDNVLEKTKAIKTIAEQFNIQFVPSVDVLGIANNTQSFQQNVENVESDSYIPERGQGGLNPEDVISKNVEGMKVLIGNIYDVLNKLNNDAFEYVVKNLEQISVFGVIEISKDFRVAFKELKSKKTLDIDLLQNAIDELSKDVGSSRLTNPQKESISKKIDSLKSLISNIQQTRGREQKIGEILRSPTSSAEDKAKELLLLKSPEKVLSYILKNPSIIENNRKLIIDFISQDKDAQDIEAFVELSEQIIVSFKLTDEEKDSLVQELNNTVKTMQSTESKSVVAETIALLDALIASGQMGEEVSRRIVPQLISSVKRETTQMQQSIVANVVERTSKLGRDGAISQGFLQNFSEIRRIVTNSSKADVPSHTMHAIKGTEIYISSLPIEVLSNDFSHEAARSVLGQTESAPQLLDNEKVSNYLLEYLTSFLKLSSWEQTIFQHFSVNIYSLLGLSNTKGSELWNKGVNDAVQMNNNPQEAFVSVLKILSLYESNIRQETPNQRYILDKLSESYDIAMQYLITSLPTLGNSVSQAVSYLSYETRTNLRDRIESSLGNGATVLKRGYETILNGLNEADRKA
ncbi:MAG: hypothetical protein PHF25_08965 [Candidatus Margulisbacteria bacterium]|nr:hypothetical protein [Candidatus Margulisiibacteriota bacterium]